MLATALAVMIGAARADDDAARAALAHAIQRYLDGDAAGARQELRALLALGSELPADVRRQTMLWMGDLLFAEGGPAAAQNLFETLLAEAPDYPIDPYAHSAQVVAYFEERRAALRPAPPDDPEPPELRNPPQPWPWTTLLPGGIGWFVEKKPVAGAVIGGLQVASIGLSIATYVQLRDTWPGEWPSGGEFPQEQPAEMDAWYTLLAVNRTAATVGFLAYLVPIGIETGVWAGARGRVSIGPTSVMFTAQF